MTEKFQNKYRIPSARLQKWDYRWAAPYFVTICTQNRECYFGEINHGKMNLSEIGSIVETEWLKTFEIRPDMNLQMGEYVVMPNHFHAIIIIGENRYNRTDCRDAMHCVSTKSTKSTKSTESTESTKSTESSESTESNAKNKFGPQSKNLASIIRGFKMGVTTNARKIHADFGWQTRYYDHIIKDEESYLKIKTYITENPVKWVDDKFYNQL